jgi:UDPglucose--hexose-1-phosphate uridylyltransferase
VPQLRQDIITGRWVAVATERAKRPDSFTQAAKEVVPANAVCPFCEGHEAMTPPEVLAYRADGLAPNTPGWSVRVVPNLYAAFKLEAEGQRRVNGLFPLDDAVGACEVLISSPDHTTSTPGLPLAQVQQIVRSYHDRMAAHAKNPKLEYVIILYNHGRPAGASLEHPHSQLYAIALVPPVAQEELVGARRFRQSHGVCVFCRLVEEEARARERVVLETEEFLVYAPFASRVPFETWIVPKRHRSRFLDTAPGERDALAEALRVTLGKLQRGLNDPPYNYFLHSAPLKGDHEASYHWHIEILPKLSIWAAFELGTGVLITVARPEDAAAFLKAAD